MKSPFFLFIVILLTACQQLALQNYHEFLDLTFQPYYEIPLSKIEVNGKSVDAYIDLGGDFDVVLPKEIIEQLKLSPQKGTQKYSGVAGQTLEAKLFSGNVRIGNLEPELSTVQEYQKWGFEFCSNDPYLHELPELLKAYVGLGLLKKHNLLLDLSQKTIGLFPSSQSSPPYTGKRWHESPAFVTSNGIEIPLRVRGAFVRAVLDTGANLSTLIQDHPVLECIIKGESKENNLLTLTLTETSIGQLNLRPLVVICPPNMKSPNTNIILGCDFMKNYLIYIDFNNQKIWIQQH